MFILLFLLIFLAAVSFGVMGLGSGIYYTPLLAWFGLDFVTGAVPLALLLSVFTGAGTAHTYHKCGYSHVRTSLMAAGAAFVGSPLGVLALHRTPVGAVKIVLSVVAFYVGIRALRSGEPVCHPERSYILNTGLTLLMGFLLGFFSALLGVGGGFLLTPVLLTCGYPTREAVGTSSLVVTIGAMNSFLFHLHTARFSLALAVPLIIAVVAGAKLGGIWATKVAHPKTLRTILASTIVLLAIGIGYDGITTLSR
jgi:uncharacterized membrane protein YfcA